MKKILILKKVFTSMSAALLFLLASPVSFAQTYIYGVTIPDNPNSAQNINSADSANNNGAVDDNAVNNADNAGVTSTSPNNGTNGVVNSELTIPNALNNNESGLNNGLDQNLVPNNNGSRMTMGIITNDVPYSNHVPYNNANPDFYNQQNPYGGNYSPFMNDPYMMAWCNNNVYECQRYMSLYGNNSSNTSVNVDNSAFADAQNNVDVNTGPYGNSTVTVDSSSTALADSSVDVNNSPNSFNGQNVSSQNTSNAFSNNGTIVRQTPFGTLVITNSFATAFSAGFVFIR